MMRGASIVRAWAGIGARTRDELPIIGPSAHHEGLYHQFGFSAHGFQLGPGAGAVMAELIVNGGSQTRIAELAIGSWAGALLGIAVSGLAGALLWLFVHPERPMTALEPLSPARLSA
jgi:FAD dependent oxidoreductase